MNITLTKEQRTDLENEIDSRWDEVLGMKYFKPFRFIPDDIKIELKNEYKRVISEIIFIKRSKIVHGDKYNYSLVYYVNNRTKVIIICPEHGKFEQRPDHHLGGFGCGKCVGQGFSTEEWIERFRSVHGDKYDYSKFVFNGVKIKSFVTCPQHGDFLVTPSNHLNHKNGCPKCVGRNLSDEEWIERFREVHGGKYSYDKFVFKGVHTKSIVTCPEHGDFLVTPSSHLSAKSGCPKCNQSKGEIQIENYLKQNNIKYEIQKKFDDCKHKLPLPFDFYLPDHNILIEFQGIQHYKPLKYFGGENYLKYTIKNDQIKRDFCSKPENPNLLEISYKKIKEISSILEKNLKIPPIP